MKMIRLAATATLPIAAAMALSACGSSEEPEYEADATTQDGSELIVNDVDPNAAPVDLPETEMTMSPDEPQVSQTADPVAAE